MENQITFEQIEQHIKATDLSAFEPGGAKHFAAQDVAQDPSGVLAKVCSIYHVIKPVLTAILAFPLIPSSIKTPIKTFMALMNTLCP